MNGSWGFRPGTRIVPVHRGTSSDAPSHETLRAGVLQDLKRSQAVRPSQFGGMPGKKTPPMKSSTSIATVLAAAVVLSAPSALAQDQSHADRNSREQAARDRQVTEDQSRGVAEGQAADREAEIRAMPSNWGPGEIRSNENYGAIAWYEKGGGDYGYIVARGYISRTSAEVQMMMECDQRRVTCEESRVVSNQWLAIGKRTDIVHYVTAAGQTREEASAAVAEQCRAEGGTCTVLDVFDINPHRRGMAHLRPGRTVQR